MSNEKLDLKDAQSAFNTFFNPNPAHVPPEKAASNPAEKVVNSFDSQKASPQKIDSSSGKVEEASMMSADEAERIVEARTSFKDVLKELDVKYSDLFSIIDEFLEKGFYEEKHQVKSLQFAFRSKKIHSVSSINDALDGSKYTLPSAAGHLLMERSMAATLTYFKIGKQTPRVFSHDNGDDDDKVLEFIRQELTTPIYNIIANKLRKFDIMTGLASSNEAIEHFLAHTQD